MNNPGIPLSFSPAIPPLRTIALALMLTASLGLTACGSGDSQDTKTSASKGASSAAAGSDQATSSNVSQSASPSSSEESIPENNPAASALAQAAEVKVDTEEVKTAQDLYKQVQGVLAEVQPADVAAAEESPSADENARPTSYLSEDALSRLETLTTGSALDQYVAEANEYAANGWRVEGSSQVVGTPKIADGEYKGQAAKILEVCLDSSKVKVVNASGTQVNSAHPARSLNIFTLIEDNGEWKIASQDFPNNADC